MQVAEGGKCGLDANNTGTNIVKGPKLTVEHWNRDIRPVDGRDKIYRNQAVGTAQNWVFLQPRWAS